MKKRIETKIILGEFILGTKDPQHPQTVNKIIDSEQITLPRVEELRKSAEYYMTPVYILTNGDDVDTSNNLQILHDDIKINEYGLSIYFLRWKMALDFLIKHPEVEKVALVDATDVKMINYPFDLVNENKLYIGDEFKDISTGIVEADTKPLYIEEFFSENPQLQLLNPGVIIGTRAIIVEFLTIFVEKFTDAQLKTMRNIPNNNFGQYEMALVNYIAYRYFNRRLIHGRKVSTIFAYNEKSSSAWFKHK